MLSSGLLVLALLCHAGSVSACGGNINPVAPPPPPYALYNAPQPPPTPPTPPTPPAPPTSVDLSICCAAVGQASHTEFVASADQGLDNPRDLEFNPKQPGVLWIANNDTDSLTLLDTSVGGGSNSAVRNSAMPLEDRAPFHYMERISSLAFEPSGYFASCNEGRNTYDDTQLPPNDFMGPTLYNGAFSALVNSRARPCSVNDKSTTCYFTHYDMLHEAPVCMGIAHDTEKVTTFGHVYWVYDGMEKMLVRFDFQEPHGPGSLDHSRASVRRFEDVKLTPVLGVPSHMMMDPVARVLYVADTGSGRVLRINPDSGRFARNARHQFSIYSSMAETFEYSIYTCTDQHVFASGINQPCGLHVDEQFVYVGEHGTGKILVYSKQTGKLVSAVATGARDLLGLAKSPLTGELWFTDGLANRVGKVVVDTPCGLSSRKSSASAASAVDWKSSTCRATPKVDTDADRKLFKHRAFLNTHSASSFPANYPSNYATMTKSECGLVNFDVLLMEGFICHVCLPEPCKHGGRCVHHAGTYTLGGFSCQCPLGFSGDICHIKTLPPVSTVSATLTFSTFTITAITEGSSARATFEKGFKKDLAKILSVAEGRLSVTGVTPGSVKVAFTIAPSAGVSYSTTALKIRLSVNVDLENLAQQAGLGIQRSSLLPLDNVASTPISTSTPTSGGLVASSTGTEESSGGMGIALGAGAGGVLLLCILIIVCKNSNKDGSTRSSPSRDSVYRKSSRGGAHKERTVVLGSPRVPTVMAVPVQSSSRQVAMASYV